MKASNVTVSDLTLKDFQFKLNLPLLTEDSIEESLYVQNREPSLVKISDREKDSIAEMELGLRVTTKSVDDEKPLEDNEILLFLYGAFAFSISIDDSIANFDDESVKEAVLHQVLPHWIEMANSTLTKAQLHPIPENLFNELN